MCWEQDLRLRPHIATLTIAIVVAIVFCNNEP